MPIVVDVQGGFDAAVASVMAKVLGENSIYAKTIAELDALYTKAGITGDAKNKIIAEVSAQLAINTTNSAINAAVEIAKSQPVVQAQVSEIETRIATEVKRGLLVDRQKAGYDDKLKVEASKGMCGIAQMEATSVGVSAEVLAAAKITLNELYDAAGEVQTIL